MSSINYPGFQYQSIDDPISDLVQYISMQRENTCNMCTSCVFMIDHAYRIAYGACMHVCYDVIYMH